METMSSFIRRARRLFTDAAWLFDAPTDWAAENRGAFIHEARELFRRFSVDHGGGKTPYLLSTQSSKLSHNETSGYADALEEVVMYLAPADTSGVLNVCPWSTAGCRAVCLHDSGRLALPPAQRATLIRTLFMYEYPYDFALLLLSELRRHSRRVEAKGKTLVVRLNGTSDILWQELFPEMHRIFEDVVFSEYSKEGMNNLQWRDASNDPHNLYRVHSATERTPRRWIKEAKVNVVVPFKVAKGEPLPASYLGKPVIDGDLHDFRFADPQGGVIVGVRGKGKAMHDESGFTVEVSA